MPLINRLMWLLVARILLLTFNGTNLVVCHHAAVAVLLFLLLGPTRRIRHDGNMHMIVMTTFGRNLEHPSKC